MRQRIANSFLDWINKKIVRYFHDCFLDLSFTSIASQTPNDWTIMTKEVAFCYKLKRVLSLPFIYKFRIYIQQKIIWEKQNGFLFAATIHKEGFSVIIFHFQHGNRSIFIILWWVISEISRKYKQYFF